jgi:hypothetical protein
MAFPDIGRDSVIVLRNREILVNNATDKLSLTWRVIIMMLRVILNKP